MNRPLVPLRAAVSSAFLATLVCIGSCRPKEGKGFTPANADGSPPPKAVNSQGARVGAADNDGNQPGGNQSGANSSTGGTGGAPPAIRRLEEPKTDDPNQGQPEKSALPKNLEPEKK